MAEDLVTHPPPPTVCYLPALFGFTIELLQVNTTLHIQDTSGNHIDEAEVTITHTFPVTEYSDTDGCVSLLMTPNVISDLKIEKDFYKIYESKVILLPESIFTDPLKNFIIMVTDGSGNPIPGASVDIKVGGVTTSSGTTNASGIFEGEIDTDSINDLTISKSGFSNFLHQFQQFLPFHCESVGFRLVPIIKLTT